MSWHLITMLARGGFGLPARWTLAAVAWIVSAPAQNPAVQAVGLVLEAGDAQLIRSKQRIAVAARPGDLLFPGDRLRSASGGSVRFTFCPSEREGGEYTLAGGGGLRIEPAKIDAREGRLTGPKPVEHCALPAVPREPVVDLRPPKGLAEPGPRRGTPAGLLERLAAPARQALFDLDAALRRNASDLQASLSRAVLLARGRLFGEAAQEYARIAARQPDQPWPKLLTLDNSVAESPASPGANQTYAVVIGIARYKYLKPDEQLRFADRDAQQFAEYLKSERGGRVAAERIELLVNQRATLAGIRNAIQNTFRRAGQQDRMVLFISAHGAVSDGKAYVVAYDSNLGSLPSSGYSMATLSALLRDYSERVGRLDVFVDACRAGSIGPITEPNRVGDRVRSTLQARSGPLIALLATRKNEEAWEHENFDNHGAFTYFLLEALNTDTADRSGDRKISVSEVLRHVRNGVEDGTLDHQHPSDYLEVERLGQEVMAETGKSGVRLGGWKPMPTDAFARRKGPRAASEEPRAPAETPLGSGELAQLTALEDRGQEILQKYLEGDEFPQEQSDFERGADIYQKALALAPGAVDLESRRDFFLGRVRIFEKKYGEAVEMLERAARLDPGSAVAFNALGIAYLEQALYDRAILAFEDAIRRSVYWAYSRHNLALALTESGEYDAAIRTYQAAMRLAPQYSYLPYNLGLLYQRLNRRREAAEAYRLAKRLAPQRPAPSIALGVLEGSERDFRDALDILARHPDERYLAVARHNLAVLLARQEHRLAEAEQLWQQNTTSANYLPSRFSLAEALLERAGKTRDPAAAETLQAAAVQEYEAIVAADPKNLSVRLQLAGMLRKQPERARKHLLEARTYHPENGLILVRLAELAAAEGRAGEALGYYEDALKVAGDPEIRKSILKATKGVR